LITFGKNKINPSNFLLVSLRITSTTLTPSVKALSRDEILLLFLSSDVNSTKPNKSYGKLNLLIAIWGFLNKSRYKELAQPMLELSHTGQLGLNALW